MGNSALPPRTPVRRAGPAPDAPVPGVSAPRAVLHRRAAAPRCAVRRPGSGDRSL